MIINGEIITFLKALGCRQGDVKILDAITLIASDFEIETVKYDDLSHVYFHFFKSGVDFTFNSYNSVEELKAIFIYVKEIDGYLKYPFIEDFIDGISSKVTMDDIANILGVPECKKKKWIRYKYYNNYIHFEFNESNELALISLFTD